MLISRVQLCRVAVLILSLSTAVGAGSDAQAYPGGAVISTGINPVAAYGGDVPRSTTVTVLTASSDQDFVITDVNLTPAFSTATCRAYARITLRLSPGGGTVARYNIGWSTMVSSYLVTMPSSIDSHMISGIRVPAGSALEMQVDDLHTYNCSTWDIAYTLAGYHSQP